MAIGFFLYHLDKTTCGGRILAGASDDTYEIGGIVRQQVREGDPVTCGKHEGRFRVCGGMGDTYQVGGELKEWAGSLDSYSSCPCRARFIPSVLSHTYDSDCNAGRVAERKQEARKKKLIEAKEKGLEPMPIPALIYATQRTMDDYGAKDMQCGDLSEAELKTRFGLTDISARVNPYTLTLIPPVAANPYSGFYPGSLMEEAVSRDESARLMFDEFRELAHMFSFHGPYKELITEMIDHMQENSGTPYSSPLLDRALKEQILNDRSEQSSLLKIKEIISTYMNGEYFIYPLEHKYKFMITINEFSILPKFGQLIDRTNGLVIAIHDTWATHITLKSLEVEGNAYRAKVHYHIQDHFGLDDADVLNPVYRKFRIFRLWFALQRWNKYGYKPFITEMNTTVEVTGRWGE